MEDNLETVKEANRESEASRITKVQSKANRTKRSGKDNTKLGKIGEVAEFDTDGGQGEFTLESDHDDENQRSSLGE